MAGMTSVLIGEDFQRCKECAASGCGSIGDSRPEVIQQLTFLLLGETLRRFIPLRRGVYLMPMTIESSPTSGSTRVAENPASRIQPAQSAPV